MDLLTIRQLEVFAQTVEFGGFRRCAEHIGMSQAAVSEHISALEERLGCRLFERQAGAPPLLTTDGERAFARISTILKELNELVFEFAGPLRDGRQRNIKVSGHPYLLRRHLNTCSQFEREHPWVHIDMDFSLHRPEDIAAALNRLQTDISLFVDFKPPFRFFAESIAKEPLALFAHSSHPLASLQTVGVQDLLQHQWIALTPQNYFRKITNHALAEAGLGSVTLAAEVDNYGLVLECVRNALGFVCLFEAPEAEMADSGVVRLRTDFELPVPQVYQAMRTIWRQDPLMIDLAKRLTAYSPSR